MDRCQCDKRVGEGCPICKDEKYEPTTRPAKFIQILTHKADSYSYRLVALDEAGGVWQYDYAAEGWVRLNMKRCSE